MPRPVTKSFQQGKHKGVRLKPDTIKELKRFANRLNRARVNQAIREGEFRDWDEPIATSWDF